MEEYKEPRGLRRARHVYEGEQHRRARQHARHQTPRQQRAARKHHHEAQKVERQRDDPQQRHGHHVRRDVGRNTQHETRRDEREQDPARSSSKTQCARRNFRRRAFVRCFRRRAFVCRALRVVVRRLAASAERCDGAGEDERGEREVCERPSAGLLSEREAGFEQERETDERDEAPGVRRGVEEVWV